MNLKTYPINKVIKAASLFALLASGLFAIIQYKDIQEREFKKPFYEEQIKTIGEVFDTLNEVDRASSDIERKNAATKFWMVYHGKASTFLDSKMFAELNVPAEYVAACITKVRKHKIISCENLTASMSAVGFAKVARQQLALGWKQSFDSIGKEDTWQINK